MNTGHPSRTRILSPCRRVRGSSPAGLAAAAFLIAAAFPATAQIVAFDMVESGSQNLVSFTNPFDGAFGSLGDGFQKYQRSGSPSIPFALLDDSLSIFPADTLGIVREGNTDVFFGVVDTENPDNGGPVSAVWEFDVSSAATGLELSIDMGAMGDFESSDFFEWTYSIDGGPELVAFSSTVDEAGSFTYVLEGGASFTLPDPMLVQGAILSNELTTFSTPLVGTGSTLVLTLTASFNGASEAVAFQNLVVAEAAPTAVAFDMVESGSQNLVSFTNPFDGVFGSPGDGFQKYQRFVSPSIPFAVLDDSLSIFPADTLGIVQEGNTDVFFGVVDTVNPENSGEVSAEWQFDVSFAASGLELSIDMGAMGDFESSDFFEWTYSIDGGPELVAFSSTVDEAGSFTYVLEGGASFTLPDPMLVQGTVLSNELSTFTAPLVGTGSILTLTLTASFNGAGEAAAFQNLVVTEGEGPPPLPTVEIFEIQGDGPSSPFAGSVVSTPENVVTVLASNGFFMQTPVARADGDVDTSDGIFVFTGGAPGVAVGDLVDVVGEVQEFFGFTELAGSPTITVVGNGALPPPVLFDATVPSPLPDLPSCALEYECYEGMFVEIAQGTVVGPNQRFGSDPLAEVYVTAAPQRTFREPGILFPGLDGLPVWDGNPEIFELDPDRLGLPNRVLPAGSSFSASGVLGFEFGGYEMWPSALTAVLAELPDPVRPRNPGELTVGTLNLFRLFDDVDDPADGERDDEVVSTDEYVRRLLKLAVHVTDVLDAPDVLAVQEAEKLGVLEDLAAAIELYAPTILYSAYLVEGNDVGTIDVGFLVKESVQVEDVTQLGRYETFVNPITGENDILHDRPPLLLEGSLELEFGSFPIAVLAVHNRSLNLIDSPSQGERVRQKRFEQAKSIANMAQALQADPGVRLVVAGDFNAFEFTDGYVDAVGIIRGDFDPASSLVCETNVCDDLVEPDLVNEILSLPAAERYSFVFRGSAQVLDHVLTSQSLEAEVTGADFGRGNADAAVDLVNDDLDPANLPLRASDHDGVVVYVLADEDADGVPNDDDVCPETVIPEGVPTAGLATNRFALVDGDGIFDTSAPNGRGPDEVFSLGDTAGCSCEQIIDAVGLGQGHRKHGCSLGAMRNWVADVSP